MAGAKGRAESTAALGCERPYLYIYSCSSTLSERSERMRAIRVAMHLAAVARIQYVRVNQHSVMSTASSFIKVVITYKSILVQQEKSLSKCVNKAVKAPRRALSEDRYVRYERYYSLPHRLNGRDKTGGEEGTKRKSLFTSLNRDDLMLVDCAALLLRLGARKLQVRDEAFDAHLADIPPVLFKVRPEGDVLALHVVGCWVRRQSV